MSRRHIDQARRNYRVYKLLSDEEFVDWAATALFYTALHIIDARLEEMLGTAPASHRARAQWLSRLPLVQHVQDAYDDLRLASETARYGDWAPILDADRLAHLHDGPYRRVCEHFEAPDAIIPQ
ncbi:MAG: hypothetical protein GF393_04840 [Armatimonadia bacterium]|nr:hypothetical protein [Armatimonadia bacterium]